MSLSHSWTANATSRVIWTEGAHGSLLAVVLMDAVSQRARVTLPRNQLSMRAVGNVAVLKVRRGCFIALLFELSTNV